MPGTENRPSTLQKALELNLDTCKYGTIAEIGAGQEVARNFFQAGGAAGTIAKTMSAYDMQFSDAIYGQMEGGRYVSQTRLGMMLDHEYELILERVKESRPSNSTFFAYAATVTARSYKQKRECHGWLGIRLQLYPAAPPSEVMLHVRMLDDTNQAQAEALGVLGVNLIYGAFNLHTDTEEMIRSLTDGVSRNRLEIDMIHFSGPYFEDVENRLMNLYLVQVGHTHAVMFDSDGQVVLPWEKLYKKNILAIRGTFKPTTRTNIDMIEQGWNRFETSDQSISEENSIILTEITTNTVMTGDTVDASEFLARVDLLGSLGYTVLISNYLRYFRLRAYFRRYTQSKIGIVLGIRNVRDIFDASFYDGIEGGLMEAMGKLFADDTHLYVYPEQAPDEAELTTATNLKLDERTQLIYQQLLQNGSIQAIDQYDPECLKIFSPVILQQIRSGSGDWEDKLPNGMADQIKSKSLLGYRPA
ncbi:MAG: TonB-dependent receptor [Gammaproteobacteria bacterium]|nr:TonB-dependent receptor [Gammaproteobacteria bacterium]